MHACDCGPNTARGVNGGPRGQGLEERIWSTDDMNIVAGQTCVKWPFAFATPASAHQSPLVSVLWPWQMAQRGDSVFFLKGFAGCPAPQAHQRSDVYEYASICHDIATERCARVRRQLGPCRGPLHAISTRVVIRARDQNVHTHFPWLYSYLFNT